MAAFDAQDLRNRGFSGFVPVRELRGGTAAVPAVPGVYAVLRVSDEASQFLRRSPGSWFKGKDPTVPLSRLHEEWVEGAETLYIGSGNSLRDRIGLLVEFSDGWGRIIGLPLGWATAVAA